MAKLSSDGKYVTVERGDTLTQIAVDYAGGYNNYKKLAAINGIANPNRIYVGQKIYLTTTGGTTTNSGSSNKPKIKQFGPISTSPNTLFATWEWNKANTASYKVSWKYDTGDNVWLVGDDSEIAVNKDDPNSSKQSTYDIPSNARRVEFRVKPISEKKTTNGNETYYWTAQYSDREEWYPGLALPVPPVPTIELDRLTLTVSVDNVPDIDYPETGRDPANVIRFEIYQDNSTLFDVGVVDVVTGHASYSCAVEAGHEYKARCRRVYGIDLSEWSEYSDNVSTIPNGVAGITTIRATSETSVYLEWEGSTTAKSYDIEYATELRYFDGSDNTTTRTGIETTHYEVTGLETGDEYFFRVRAVRDDVSSEWCEPRSVRIGEKPAAPTTWSSTTVAVTGEVLNLYWVHNSADGSSQEYAQLELVIGGVTDTYDIANDRPEDEKDKTSVYPINTSRYQAGTKILWRVRTAGVTHEYGDWSIQRTVDIYARPGLDLQLFDISYQQISTVTSFPIRVHALASPNTQAPTSYHLSIMSNETYSTVDNAGNPININRGQVIYSRHFDIMESLDVTISAGDVDLENNVTYTMTCVVSMNSGLTATNSLDFNVTWEDVPYEPNAEISIDENTYAASIRPYCMAHDLTKYVVNRVGSTYVATDIVVDLAYGTVVPRVTTTTGEVVYSGVNGDGEDIYYCFKETMTIMSGVMLSVYRREFDGTFTELATNLDSDNYTTIVDPHPSLDYARYRIVATSKATGAVSFYDLPGYPVGGIAAIIQWDEAWSSFDTTEESALAQPAWTGSMLKLPYNIDVSDDNDPDVSLVNFIGRSHPVAYYGTHRGSKSTWNMVIDKKDKETLYGLRRLANWMGNVYVREPSGSGYWASVKVSYNQKHTVLTIPVTLNISRVEGGA
jgi:hypothetical protein